MRRGWVVPFAVLALVAGCGDLPQPYRGRPGGQAGVLAIPMALRLAIAPPPGALLSDSGAQDLADSLATALQKLDVPAIATDRPLPLDWRVEITAEQSGQSIRPRFRMIDADGKAQATAEGDRIPLRDWANATRPLLDQVAAQAAPKITQLILVIEAARKSTDPASLAAGPPRIRMAGIKGAPGDGNAALGARMREFLGNQGFVVQDAADGAAYALEGDVAVVPARTGVERVEIQWVVSRRDGQELGRVVQINEVPAERLNRLWGDVAYAAAEEAAPGIKTVVANAIAPPPTAEAAPLVAPQGLPAGPAATRALASPDSAAPLRPPR